jgi:hypothetical protein
MRSYEPGMFVTPSRDGNTWAKFGEQYEILHYYSEAAFRVIMHSGTRHLCLWKGCAHLEGGDWYLVHTPTDAIERELLEL